MKDLGGKSFKLRNFIITKPLTKSTCVDPEIVRSAIRKGVQRELMLTTPGKIFHDQILPREDAYHPCAWLLRDKRYVSDGHFTSQIITE